MSLPGQGDGGPPSWEEQSGKLSALTCLLLAIKQSGGERVVVVSLFTAMLDIIQELCDRYNIIMVEPKHMTESGIHHLLESWGLPWLPYH